MMRIGQWAFDKQRLLHWLPTGYYYFFYGALGSLLPYLNLYYRTIGLDPWQIGLLGGIRPLLALLCGPLWSCVTNKYKIRKAVILVSLVSWIVFTLPIAFVQHAREGRCEMTVARTAKGNHSRAIRHTSALESEIVDSNALFHRQLGKSLLRKLIRSKPTKTTASNAKLVALIVKRSKPLNQIAPVEIPRYINQEKTFGNTVGLPGLRFEETAVKTPQRKPNKLKSHSSPYTNKRKNPFAGSVFGEVFFLVLFGEMLQSPTDDLNTHYDGTPLENLGVLFQNLDKNSKFSSLGIGLVAFCTGIIVHHAAKIEICDKLYSDYRITFYIFAIFMTIATTISMTFDFIYRRRRRSFDIKDSLETLISFRHLGFFLIVLLMGIFRGVLFNFLFWNLSDIGGSDMAVGLTVVSQYFSDSLLYSAAPLLVSYIGYIGMIFCGLASYALRFLIYSWLNTPKSAWVAAPVELLQGFSHATAWSAFVLYIANYTPKSTFATGMFLLQAIYLGVGGSLGSIFSGIFIQIFDTDVAFRMFSLLSIFSCLVFLMVQPSGSAEVPASQVDTISYFADDDEYSSISEEELYDYREGSNIIYLPPKENREGLVETKKTVLPSANSPFVPTFMSLVKNDDYL